MSRKVVHHSYPLVRRRFMAAQRRDVYTKEKQPRILGLKIEENSQLEACISRFLVPNDFLPIFFSAKLC